MVFRHQQYKKPRTSWIPAVYVLMTHELHFKWDDLLWTHTWILLTHIWEKNDSLRLKLMIQHGYTCFQSHLELYSSSRRTLEAACHLRFKSSWVVIIYLSFLALFWTTQKAWKPKQAKTMNKWNVSEIFVSENVSHGHIHTVWESD